MNTAEGDGQARAIVSKLYTCDRTAFVVILSFTDAIRIESYFERCAAQQRDNDDDRVSYRL